MQLHYTPDQIAGFLRELEQGDSVRAVCARHGISPASLYAWRAKYSRPMEQAAVMTEELAGEVKRLEKELHLELGDIEVMHKLFRKMLSNTNERREVVRVLMDFGLSERQALRAIGLSASSFRYARQPSPSQPAKRDNASDEGSDHARACRDTKQLAANNTHAFPTMAEGRRTYG